MSFQRRNSLTTVQGCKAPRPGGWRLRIGVGVVVGMVVGLVVGLVMALQVARVVGVVGGWSGRNGAMPLTPGRAHAWSVLERRAGV